MTPTQKQEEKEYRVCSLMFKGGNDDLGYTYEITFNKSLVHTGRFTGISDGLNAYVKKEKKGDVKESFMNFVYSLKRFFKQ